MMKQYLIYVELKSEHRDDGPAWIGFYGASKTDSTIYFNGMALKPLKDGQNANHYDQATGDEYWVSGIKRNDRDRHKAGHRPIQIDISAVGEYLSILETATLPINIEPARLKPSIAIDRPQGSESTRIKQRNRA